MENNDVQHDLCIHHNVTIEQYNCLMQQLNPYYNQ